MDAKQQPEQNTGRTDGAAEEAVEVSREAHEENLLTLTQKYRAQPGGIREADITPEDRKVFSAGWLAQAEHWEGHYEDFVSMVNDINSYLAMRYKGVPDLLIASVALSASQHLMAMCSQHQFDKQRRPNDDDAEEMARAIAQRLGLASAEPAGHG